MHTSRGRRHQEQIRRLCEEDVVESAFEVAAFGVPLEDVGVNLVPGERAERQGRHEAARARRHQDNDVETAVLQPAQDFGGLVAGDSAADTQRNLAARC